MSRTTRPTTCWAKCGVRGFATQAEKDMLALATEYKQRLAELEYNKYCAELDARNRLFPDLWAALTTFEIAKAARRDCESAIKQANSTQRSRLAKSVEQKSLHAELKRLKAKADSCYKAVVSERAKYNTVKNSLQKIVDAIVVPKHVLDMPEDTKQQKKDKQEEIKKHRDPMFKNVKSIEKKEKVYADILSRIDDPIARELKSIEWEADLQMKRLSKEYQDLGLNSGTRGSIASSVEPKTKKDGPGMKYIYGKFPEVEPVNNLTIQFGGGGVTQAMLLTGKGGVTMTPSDMSKRVRKDYGSDNLQKQSTLFAVQQQIGTSDKPVVSAYSVNIHKPLPEDVIIQRWVLCFDEHGKRSVSMIVSRERGFAKEIGSGTFAVDTGHKKHSSGGLKIADFVGDNVNEELVLPTWLVDKFNDVYNLDSEIDDSARTFLDSREMNVRKNRAQAIKKLAAQNPDDGEANAWVEWHSRAWTQRNRRRRKLIRIRNKIYENVVARLRSTHSSYIEDDVSYADMGRNATKDVTDESAKLQQEARRNRVIASPGLLIAMLKRSGLTVLTVDERGTSSICEHCGADNSDQLDRSKETRSCKDCKRTWNKDRGACLEKLARADVPSQNIRVARTTDIFTTYVENIDDSSTSIKGGNRRRSQMWSQGKAA